MRNGFTLLEVLLGFSLLIIILCFSFSFSPHLYKKNQLQIVTDQLNEAIRFAKTQAILTNKRLILKPLTQKGDWSEGVVVIIDTPKQSDTKLLHEWCWPSSGIHISWQGFQSNNYLLFAPEMTSNTINGTFIISNAIQQKKLIVNRVGRVKVL